MRLALGLPLICFIFLNNYNDKIGIMLLKQTANTKQVRAAKREEVIRNQSTNIEMVQEKKWDSIQCGKIQDLIPF